MTEFRLSFEVKWADLDPNGHVRHTAFHDYATHVRFRYLETHGFGVTQFKAHNLGPVILREEARFFNEVGMNDTLTVDFRAKALSSDLARFRLTHEVRRSDDVKAATVTVEGGWLDLGKRALVRPPPELAEVMSSLPRTEDFKELPPLLKR